tara:strand:+ start:118 stop:996 length:879 start_codon:yes stop_codon:yes gene_type:complete
MVYYECQRCGYNTTLKGNIKHHLNRKYVCEPILSDISIYDMKSIYNLNLNEEPKNNPHNPIIKNNEPKNVPFMCLYCNKIFKRNWHLSRHLTSCKVKKKELNKQNNEITLLKLQQQKLEETVEKLLIECSNKSNSTINSNNSNNTNSNNTNNTIIINNYGEEDTKYITKQFIVNLLANKPFKAIPEMIKHTHFNKEHPENQNIKLTNKKEPYVKVMKDNKWLYQDRKNTITDLIDKQHIKISDEKIEQKVEKHCTKTQKNNIARCNDLYVNDDEDYMKRLYNESELVVINNS